MNRTEVTYGQLDHVLRALGFSCRPAKHDPPGRVYEHQETGALVMLPTVADSEQVLERHLVAVQIELENFGLADPKVFAARIQKAG